MKKKLTSVALATASVAGIGVGVMGASAPANASVIQKQYHHSAAQKYANYADCQKNMAGAIANVYRIGGHLTTQPSCKGRAHTTGNFFNRKTVYWMTYIGFDYQANRAANAGDKPSGPLGGFWN